jgi:hypothetical protein
MNVRLSFRVEEQRDVDLVLGQGKLRASWHAHKLNAPGKFLLRSPEHDTPRRARAYLITDDVTDAVTRYAPARPPLDPISRRALAAPPSATAQPGDAEGGNDANAGQPEDPEDEPESILRTALSLAPEEGSPSPISSRPLARAGGGSNTGSANSPQPGTSSRPHADTGASHPQAATVSNQMIVHVHPHAPASAPERAYTRRAPAHAHITHSDRERLSDSSGDRHHE